MRWVAVGCYSSIEVDLNLNVDATVIVGCGGMFS